MVENRNCPQCGAQIPGDAPWGICPQCLMLAGMADPKVDDAANDSGHVDATASHAGAFVPPNPESLAQHFPQLEILEPLGHGGMGAVYKARQVKLDRYVALKIIRPESADDPAFAERFNREARTLARLNHPNIVAVHDFGEMTLTDTNDIDAENFARYYFVMEYVDGANLRRLIQSGELQPEQSLTIVPQICEALQYAHEEGIVHRDIKPENVLIDQRGRVKIADFGLAKLASRSEQDFTLTGTNQVMGTPRYMAPEQMEGSHSVDHRADIYSLGVVFYEMLTGRVPAGHFDPPSKIAPVDERLDPVVLRAMAHEPSDRFQQAGEISSHVHQIQNQSEGSHVATAEQPIALPAGPSTLIDRAVGMAVQVAKPRSLWHLLHHSTLPAVTATLLCIGGIATMFIPWGLDRIIYVPGGAKQGAAQWILPFQEDSGIALGVVFLSLGLILFGGSTSGHRPGWRPWTILLCGAVSLATTGMFYDNVLARNGIWIQGTFYVALAICIGLMIVGAWDMRCLLTERNKASNHRLGKEEVVSQLHAVREHEIKAESGNANVTDDYGSDNISAAHPIDAAASRTVQSGRPRVPHRHIHNAALPAILAVLLSIGGLATLFLPWASYLTDSAIPERRWFHAYDEVWGVLGGMILLGLILVLSATTTTSRRPVWRPWIILTSGAGLLVLTASFQIAVLSNPGSAEAEAGFLAAFGICCAFLIVGVWDLRCLLTERNQTTDSEVKDGAAGQSGATAEKRVAPFSDPNSRQSQDGSLLRTVLQFAAMIAVMMIGCVLLYLAMATTSVRKSETTMPANSGHIEQDFSRTTEGVSTELEVNANSKANGPVGAGQQSGVSTGEERIENNE